MRMLAAVAALGLVGAPACEAAAADPQAVAAGKQIALPACDGCHSQGGPAGSPLLAGLDATYFGTQLAAYAAGTRQDEKMTAIVKAMDAKAQADVAAYYASLAPQTSAPSLPPAPKALVDAGAQLADRGDWSKGVPRCAACHGRNGRGVGTAFPAIAGQSASYSAGQLRAWKTGARRDDPQALMRTVAARLGDEQIAAVAAYYATLPAGTTRPGEAR